MVQPARIQRVWVLIGRGQQDELTAILLDRQAGAEIPVQDFRWSRTYHGLRVYEQAIIMKGALYARQRHGIIA